MSSTSSKSTSIEVATRVRVVLAEDHDMVRAGFEALLSEFDGYEVVAAVDDGDLLLETLAKVQADLVITDISMPSLDGIEAITRIHHDWPDIKILVVSMDESGRAAKRALSTGAKGYVSKAAATAELRTAMNTVMSGREYCSPNVLRQMVLEPEHSDSEKLTTRQKEILKLIVKGKSKNEIGRMLNLSTKTVSAHRAGISERLGIRDTARLTLYALKEGLI